MEATVVTSVMTPIPAFVPALMPVKAAFMATLVAVVSPLLVLPLAVPPVPVVPPVSVMGMAVDGMMMELAHLPGVIEAAAVTDMNPVTVDGVSHGSADEERQSVVVSVGRRCQRCDETRNEHAGAQQDGGLSDHAQSDHI